MLCYVVLCCVMLCYVMLCYVMLCYVMLCYVMLCYVMLCYVMLCYSFVTEEILCLNNSLHFLLHSTTPSYPREFASLFLQVSFHFDLTVMEPSNQNNEPMWANVLERTIHD